MPLPAQPVPGTGPPASTQQTPEGLRNRKSSSLSPPPLRITSSTVSIRFPLLWLIVESALGSQPIWNTLYPSFASAEATLDTVVDLPIPPLP